MRFSVRTLVLLVLVFTFLAMAVGLLGGDNFRLLQTDSRKNNPNIIFILVDDLGIGDVRAYYPEGKISTPAINALASQGVRFTDAHSGAAVCSPTRYGVLTGQHFSRQEWGGVYFTRRGNLIAEDRLTVAEFLRQEGYHTGAFGKWHLGQTWYNTQGEPAVPGPDTDWAHPMSGGPNDRGFDVFFGVSGTHAHGLLTFISDRLVTEVPTVTTETGYLAAEGYRSWHAMPKVTQKALDYISWNAIERPGKPFFLYYAPPAVHLPLVPSAQFRGKSEVGIYGDFVMQTDAAVGRILAKLEEHGIRDDTLVVFTSDNGSGGYAQNNPKDSPPAPMGVVEKFGHKANGDWRGYKGTCWEGGHRVPFIASWPGRIAPGTVSDELITLEDFFATATAILEREPPAGSAEDSYNILPYLDGSHSGPPIRKYAVLSTFNGDPILRKGDWVLTFHLGSGAQFTKNEIPQPGGAQGQLYNLRKDPQQTTNVWLNHPVVVSELTEFYKAHVARGSSFGIER